MKSCSAEKYFIDYISGELSNSEIIEFHSHLENCPSCKKQLDEFNKTHYSIKSLKRKNPPTRLVEQYHDDLAIKFSRSKSSNQWNQRISNIFQINSRTNAIIKTSLSDLFIRDTCFNYKFLKKWRFIF